MRKRITLKYDMREPGRLRRIIIYRVMFSIDYRIKIFPRFIKNE